VACGPRVAGGVADLGITGLVLQESLVTITRYAPEPSSRKKCSIDSAPWPTCTVSTEQVPACLLATTGTSRHCPRTRPGLTSLLEVTVNQEPRDFQIQHAAAGGDGLPGTSIGIKHEVTTREALLERLATAIELIMG
jgi:hypothetical protein